MPELASTTDGTPALTSSRGPGRRTASMPDVALREGLAVRYQQFTPGGSCRLEGGFRVEPDTVWELAVHPDPMHDPTSDDSPAPTRDGCCIGVEFVVDGKPVTLRDQHGHPIDGSEACLVPENWNLLQLDLSSLVGQRVDEVRLLCSQGRAGAGWLQTFGVRPAPVEAASPVDRVRTTRGSHSSYEYSRGNTLPAVSVPHGFNFLTPVTDARERSWLYGWHRDGGPRPHLQAFSFSHAPSPWIGDHSAFQVFPWQGHSSATPKKRQRVFDHADEIDRPHLYRVDLEGGIRAEMTATSHAGAFRFTFRQPGKHGVIIDQPFIGSLDCETLPDGRVAFRGSIAPELGWGPGLSHSKPPAYVYGETNVPATVGRAWEHRSPFDRVSYHGKRVRDTFIGKLAVPLPRPQAAVLHTEAPVVELRIATSFIGIDQARRNLETEMGDVPFGQLVEQAKSTWEEILGRLEITGGTLDARTTAWSNLARLYSWPNAHHEDGGLDGRAHQAYASPFRTALIHGPEHTGCEIVDGELMVNNGYWDTFRTAWPLYSLLTPEVAPKLLSGILQQYRDGGWMARWTAPGYVDCMPGTSSDVVFADASLAGTFATLADELAAYDSALRNATGPSDNQDVGRKGIGRGRFTGWIDTDTEEGLAWAMDNASCDAAISLWSGRLAARAAVDPSLVERHEEFEANEVWFANRGLAHAQLFDASVGFYQGRKPDGSFRFAPDRFDPLVWGRDFTETSAWGQAFHAPHDGAGLAALLGGEQALAAKLDEFMATPATVRPAMYGGYNHATHEMREAQDCGIGQLAMSNQPAHHIPFMYLFCGQPSKTQWLTREVLDKAFVGSEIGQGYPGDEDNGEMSGWWLFAAMGLYPLFVGGGELAITSPLFEKMAWNRPDGTRLEIRATGVEHRYIQSVRINGERWTACTVPAELLRGNALVEFELGPEPSSWGSGSRPWSASTSTGTPRTWQADRTKQAVLNGHEALVDDEGRDIVGLDVGDVVELSWPEPFEPSFLTLTSPEVEAPALRVEVRHGDAWTDSGIAPRATQHPDQTAAYRFDAGLVDGLRLVPTGPTKLSQIEVY